MTWREGTLALVAAWAVWRALKALTSKNPLDKVPGPKPDPFFFGSALRLFDPVGGWDFHAEIASKYPGIARIVGIQGSNILYTFDPKAMHHILVKDHHNVFDESDRFLQMNSLLFGPSLLSVKGDRHRRQRKLLNPVFSIAHMREMTPTFYSVAYRLRDSLHQILKEGQPTEIDIASWMTRTALELIGQSGLGTSFDSLEPDASEHPFATTLKNLLQGLSDIPFARFFLLPRVGHIGPPQFRRWVVERVPSKSIRKVVNMSDVMHRTSSEIYQRKKRALDEGDELDKSVIGILLRENMNASEEDRIPEDEVLAQLSTITFAAMDTTSNALCRVLLLLSGNPEVQERLRQEILDAKEQRGGSDLSYDELVQLPYLDAICRETLRLYPPSPFVTRQARQDTILPLSIPFISTDGKPTHEVLVPKGTLVLVSIMAANKNPELWGPDAHEWKPERWLNPLPETVVNAKMPGVYSHLMTFIGGGRSCIGFKFSQLEIKTILCSLLESFRFTPTGKKIRWQLNGVVQPTVVSEEPGSASAGKALKLQMPLNVSRL
ncbi:cytochrome P450 [Coprinopsis cinerea okayama7|uniref:Cytochrome P450 n=1 Tax=Coprinopsis cinerea (strain Okayama-7 / 130 / ATCC MYA-4618 / FGSC 9003) TaxID=240176 RepID=A8P2F0_COPC7|nr:cytochrome P450 [Coprinopsis cinerea okayama7\|eukprot:XP_001838305.2 cytochrome P450 [Coprinopsis cinerea okayama7\